jgi:hypothetical protein
LLTFLRKPGSEKKRIDAQKTVSSALVPVTSAA